MLGTDRNAAWRRSPAHSRIHLFVRRSLSRGRLLRLSDHATSNTACFQAFLQVPGRKFARQDILLVLDGAPNHRCGDLAVPNNITLLYPPPYSPELNPKENLWDEIRECLKMARVAEDEQHRAILLQIAQGWLALAQKEETNGDRANGPKDDIN